MSLMTHRLQRARRQAGVTLIEAMVALVVMSFGMIALVGLMGNLRLSTDLAKQRGEAVRLAQSELERLRSFSALESDDPTVVSFEDSTKALDSITEKTYSVSPANSNTTFTVARQVAPVIVAGIEVARSVRVIVTWMDRTGKEGSVAEAGTPQSVTLDTVIARVDPSFSGSLSVNAPEGGTRQPGNRNPAIPVGAVDLDKKKSAFRPSASKEAVWVFNNATGVIVSTCTVPTGTALTPADLAAAVCSDTTAYLLSGTVRFSNSSPANPTAPEASPFKFGVAINEGVYKVLRVYAGTRNPARDASGALVWDTYTATPVIPKPEDAKSWVTYTLLPKVEDKDCVIDIPGTERFANYFCLVKPDDSSPTKWSGRVELTGFTIGTTASEYRVCRYTADYNGNGTPYVKAGDYIIDNYEHPDVYVDVVGSLARQNFLVVKGDVDCPTAPAVDASTGVFVDYSTKQHQPQL